MFRCFATRTGASLVKIVYKIIKTYLVQPWRIEVRRGEQGRGACLDDGIVKTYRACDRHPDCDLLFLSPCTILPDTPFAMFIFLVILTLLYSTLALPTFNDFGNRATIYSLTPEASQVHAFARHERSISTLVLALHDPGNSFLSNLHPSLLSLFESPPRKPDCPPTGTCQCFF